MDRNNLHIFEDININYNTSKNVEDYPSFGWLQYGIYEVPQSDELSRDFNFLYTPNLPQYSFFSTEKRRPEAEKEIQALSEKFKENLYNMLLTEEFIPGEITQSELYIDNEIIMYGKDRIMTFIQELYMEKYNEKKILLGILHILSHYAWEDIHPYGNAIAVGCLAHKDDAINDFAIKAFENWNTQESINILKHIQLSNARQKEYVQRIIKEIEK